MFRWKNVNKICNIKLHRLHFWEKRNLTCGTPQVSTIAFELCFCDSEEQFTSQAYLLGKLAVVCDDV